MSDTNNTVLMLRASGAMPTQSTRAFNLAEQVLPFPISDLETTEIPPLTTFEPSESSRLCCRQCGLAAVGARALFVEARWLLTGEWALCNNCVAVLGAIAYLRWWVMRVVSSKILMTAFVAWNVAESLFNIYQMLRLFFS